MCVVLRAPSRLGQKGHAVFLPSPSQEHRSEGDGASPPPNSSNFCRLPEDPSVCVRQIATTSSRPSISPEARLDQSECILTHQSKVTIAPSSRPAFC